MQPTVCFMIPFYNVALWYHAMDDALEFLHRIADNPRPSSHDAIVVPFVGSDAGSIDAAAGALSIVTHVAGEKRKRPIMARSDDLCERARNQKKVVQLRT